MKKFLLTLSVILVSATSAWATAAQDIAALMGLGFSPEQASYLAGMTNALTAVTSAIVPTTDNARDLGATSYGWRDLYLSRNATIAGTLTVTGLTTLTGGASAAADVRMAADTNLRLAIYVPTMAATPAAATNDFKMGLNVVPTAAANTAALFPTPSAAGQQLVVVNNAGAAIRLKPGGTNTINGGSAGAYIPLAIAAIARCKAISTTAWYCGTEVVPTPAGP